LKKEWIFDEPHYDALNAAREPVVRRLVSELKTSISSDAPTAIDVGCGVGRYSAVLNELGFSVLGVDARRQNIDEARRRYPHLRFEVADAEEPRLGELGSYDLVFCFGLFYHMENPFRLIRSLAALAKGQVLLEGICFPSAEPVLVLMDEVESNDQGINALAYYPSEAALVKMLKRSGFSECYSPVIMPAHHEYALAQLGFRKRTVLIGSRASVSSPSLKTWPDSVPLIHPWDMMAPLIPVRGKLGRLYSFLSRMQDMKYRRKV
jgi:tRNA (mo5U34)-methyltransferase